MNQLATNFKRYLNETLDIDVHPKPWREDGNLPIFLRNMYVFYIASILEIPCLIMVARDKAEQTPATIKKQIRQVCKRWPDEVIYVQQKVTAYNRKRLIQHKIPFVIPLNQMYLPFLGVDLREHYRKIWKTDAGFSPSTQVVVLYYLSQNIQLRLTPKTLANALGYSIMTMSRALDELDGAGLGTIVMEGRERVLCFHRDKKQVWETALERLRSPIRKKLWIKTLSNRPLGVKAGLSALAYYSNLAEPANPEIAIERKHWKEIKANNEVMILDIVEPDAGRLEVWSYSPKQFGEKSMVDRFSLFLSMRENNDERVQSALSAMMEQVQW